MSILGLDIGTTGVKAVAFREDGAFITSAYREYDLKSPQPGHLELDPSEVLGAIRHVTRAVGSATSHDPVRSVAACTLGEAAVPLDASGKAVGNAIIGFDARGEEEMRAFKEKISNEEVFEITGHGINSFHTLFKILWRRDHDPVGFRKARKFLCFGDFTAAAMGVTPRMDYSVAARTLCLDIHELQWSQRILDVAGLSREILPDPVAPGEPVGELGSRAAEEFGLPRGCVVAGGLHDQPAGMLGVGVRPGESMMAIGTVICLGVHLKAIPSARFMLEGNLCYYPTVGERQYVSLAYNFTGGSLLKWYRDNLAGPEIAQAAAKGVDPYDVITDGLPAGPTNVLVLPHFTTTGTPWLDPKALGAFFGLRLTTGRKESRPSWKGSSTRFASAGTCSGPPGWTSGSTRPSAVPPRAGPGCRLPRISWIGPWPSPRSPRAPPWEQRSWGPRLQARSARSPRWMRWSGRRPKSSGSSSRGRSK
jgi:xylulokinase